MIPVTLATEPATFDAKVRVPGLRAIAELVGERPARPAGKRIKTVAATRNEIPADKFPTYWREALDDLLDSYNRICSYLCLYIARGTGAPSADHMIAKSVEWDKVYEWNNYRLACSLMNSRKGAVSEVLDPFEVEDGWFALKLVEFQVVLGEQIPDDKRVAVETTIERLKLNDPQCCEAREAYVDEYLAGHVSLDYVTRHAPFVAAELHRQGHLRPDDIK